MTGTSATLGYTKYVVYDADGDAIASGSTRLLGNSVKEACEAMRAD